MSYIEDHSVEIRSGAGELMTVTPYCYTVEIAVGPMPNDRRAEHKISLEVSRIPELIRALERASAIVRAKCLLEEDVSRLPDSLKEALVLAVQPRAALSSDAFD